MIHSLPFRLFPTVQKFFQFPAMFAIFSVLPTSVLVTVTHFWKIVILKHFGNQTPSKKEKYNGTN